jgi:hypothetical protein
VKRPGSILIVTAAVLSAAAFGAQRLGVQLPFGIELPGATVIDGSIGTSQLTVGTVYFDGAGEDTSVVVGNGGSVRLSAGYAVQFGDSSRTLPTVTLQRRVEDGTWHRTTAPVSVPQGEAMTVVTPPYAASGATATVQYRLVSGASVSRAMTVVYENQRRYTGMAATVYRFIQRYCPGSAVHVAALDGREAGDYRTGALLIRIDRAVGRTTVTDPIDQRALALHECSHERQWLNYGATAAGRTRMLAAAKRYFSVPGDAIEPVEHAADCGAQALDPGGYLGYGGTCSAVALHEGERLLLGEQY